MHKRDVGLTVAFEIIIEKSMVNGSLRKDHVEVVPNRIISFKIGFAAVEFGPSLKAPSIQLLCVLNQRSIETF